MVFSRFGGSRRESIPSREPLYRADADVKRGSVLIDAGTQVKSREVGDRFRPSLEVWLEKPSSVLLLPFG
jgi:hypothetical protein